MPNDVDGADRTDAMRMSRKLKMMDWDQPLSQPVILPQTVAYLWQTLSSLGAI